MRGIEPIVFDRARAEERVEQALRSVEGPVVMTTSFGIQAAVLLHLISTHKPGVDVIFIDTGFLFPETYRFADELTARLDITLHTYKPRISPEELVERYGEMWNYGEVGLEQYNEIVKVEPMKRALDELQPELWFAGLRRKQSAGRKYKAGFERLENLWKVYPIIDWTDRHVFKYLRKHSLPYHPLWEKGYLSVGDYHSSEPLRAGGDVEKTRFKGGKRECGLHDRLK